MDQLLEQLEALGEHLAPLLERRGISVESITPIGLLGAGAQSSVFSILIDGRHHVLKAYQNSDSFDRELKNHRKLSQPPRVILTSRKDQNSMHLDLLLTAVPSGRTLNSSDLTDRVRDQLAEQLLHLHRLRRRQPVRVELQLARFHRVAGPALRQIEIVSPQQATAARAIMTGAETYFNKYRGHFVVKKTVLHGDLWWSNIIVTPEDVYLIDWENVKSGDVLEDLAKLRVLMDYAYHRPNSPRFWAGRRQPQRADWFIQGMADQHGRELPDPSIAIRLPFYLILAALTHIKNLYLMAQENWPVTAEETRWQIDNLHRFWNMTK
jgi:thiamine kinase-like enzyme